MVVRRVGGSGVLVAAALLCLGVGCGATGVGVDACRQIEEARCRQAPACQIPLTTPNFTSGTDVDACIRYYDDACFHGLEVSNPSAASVTACVDAIEKPGNCAVVSQPQTSPACAWLNPAGSDASTTTSSADASSTDASDAATEASQ
jgi:hypothetical protein